MNVLLLLCECLFSVSLPQGALPSSDSPTVASPSGHPSLREEWPLGDATVGEFVPSWVGLWSVIVTYSCPTHLRFRLVCLALINLL